MKTHLIINIVHLACGEKFWTKKTVWKSHNPKFVDCSKCLETIRETK
jgi:hypothetical protein